MLSTTAPPARIGRFESLRPIARILVEAVFLVILAPLLLTQRDSNWVPLLALSILLPARVAVGSDVLPRPIALPMALWCALLVAAVLLGAQIASGAAWTRFFAYCYGIVAMSAVYNVCQAGGERLRRWLVPAWLLLIVGVAAAGLFITASNVTNKIPLLSSVLARVAGESFNIRTTFGNEEGLNPNVLAGTLLPAVYLPATLFLWLRAASARFRRLGLIALLAAGLWLLGVLILTQSRGAYLGFAMGALALVAMRGRRAALVIVAAAVIAMIAAAVVLPLLALDWRQYASGRFELWSRGMLIVSAFPLTGTGLNMFAPVSELLYSDLLHGAPSLIHAHNMLLQLTLDFGVFGLVFALWAMLLIWRAGVRSLAAFRDAGDGFALWAMRGLLAGQVALFVFNLTDFANLGSKQGFVFWTAWGLILGLAGAARFRAREAEAN